MQKTPGKNYTKGFWAILQILGKFIKSKTKCFIYDNNQSLNCKLDSSFHGRKIHLSRKIQYLEFFSKFCMVVELYIEFVVGQSSLHRKKFNQIRLVVLVLWNNFPCCPKRSSLLGFDILLSMYFWRWCTRHRKIRPNVFDVLCFEFSMYCIFRDRRMRPI